MDHAPLIEMLGPVLLDQLVGAEVANLVEEGMSAGSTGGYGGATASLITADENSSLWRRIHTSSSYPVTSQRPKRSFQCTGSISRRRPK